MRGGDGECQFAVHIAATLFDGATLDLRPLAGTHSLLASETGGISAGSAGWGVAVVETGNVAVTLTGH